MSPREIYDAETGAYYEVMEEPSDDAVIETALELLAAADEQDAALMNHIDGMIEKAEELKGRKFTQREKDTFAQVYAGGGLDENGQGDIAAATNAMHNFADMEDREQRRNYMAERLREQPAEVEEPEPDYSEPEGDEYEYEDEE